MPKVAKNTKRQSARGVIAGVAKHDASMSTNAFYGPWHAGSEITAVFQAQLDAIDSVDRARVALSAAVARERLATKEARKLEYLLKQRVGVILGVSQVVFNDFGWTVPKKPGPKTTQAKLEGAIKARATRAARGTMGKRQRKKARRGTP
jgi:hypothetical protein